MMLKEPCEMHRDHNSVRYVSTAVLHAASISPATVYLYIRAVFYALCSYQLAAWSRHVSQALEEQPRIN